MVYSLGKTIVRTAEKKSNNDPDVLKQYLQAFRQTKSICDLMTRLGAPPDLISQIKHARLSRANNIVVDFQDVKYAEAFLDAASPVDPAVPSCFPPFQNIRADWPRSPVSIAREQFQTTLDEAFSELADQIQTQAKDGDEETQTHATGAPGASATEDEKEGAMEDGQETETETVEAAPPHPLHTPLPNTPPISPSRTNPSTPAPTPTPETTSNMNGPQRRDRTPTQRSPEDQNSRKLSKRDPLAPAGNLETAINAAAATAGQPASGDLETAPMDADADEELTQPAVNPQAHAGH
jgi:hypothetical protein